MGQEGINSGKIERRERKGEAQVIKMDALRRSCVSSVTIDFSHYKRFCGERDFDDPVSWLLRRLYIVCCNHASQR